MKEIKDLRFELSHKDEQYAMKVETLRSMQDSLEGQRKQFMGEVDKFKKE